MQQIAPSEIASYFLTILRISHVTNGIADNSWIRTPNSPTIATLESSDLNQPCVHASVEQLFW